MSGISSVMIVVALAAVLTGGIVPPAAASPAGSAWTKLLPQGILDLGSAVAASPAAEYVFPTQRTGVTSIVSVNSEGHLANSGVSVRDISANGRYVGMASTATNLIPGFEGSGQQLYLKDVATGELECVSVSSDGVPGDRWSSQMSVSATGRYVVFSSNARNLVPGLPANERSRLFLRDRQTNETSVASVSAEGTASNWGSGGGRITPDGRYLAFSSTATNLIAGEPVSIPDYPMRDQVYIHDRQEQQITRLSVDAEGNPGGSHLQGEGQSGSPSVSADGRYVAFDTTARNLMPEGAYGHNEYLKRQVVVRDVREWTLEHISVSPDGEIGNDSSWGPVMSPDGRYVFFHSHATNLVPGITVHAQLYVYDRVTESMDCVSIGPDGSHASQQALHSGQSAISSDGRYVAFYSRATNLVPETNAGHESVFVHDRVTRVTDRISVATDGTPADQASNLPVMSADGRYVAFDSRATNLVPETIPPDEFSTRRSQAFMHDRQAIANNPPSVVTLIQPVGGAVVDRAPFELHMSATDDDPTDRLRYQVELLQDGDVVLALDQTEAPQDWSRDRYHSGETAVVGVHEPLQAGDYQWRARAYDGRDWGLWSDTAPFSFMPTVRWALHEPIGHVVQKLIFRLSASVEGTGIEAAARAAGTDRYHYRIEVSRDVDFSDHVVIFDQSVDNRGWTQEDYASGEDAGMITDYAFPINVPLYWRARMKPATGDTWSDETAVRPFRLVAGWSMVPPHRGIRVGRTDHIPVMINNPTEFTCDYLMSFDIGLLHVPNVVGTARLIDPSGEVVEEVVINEGPLEFITEELGPGRHLFHVEVSTDWAQAGQQITPQNGIVIPTLVFLGKVAIGYVGGMIIEASCRELAKLALQEDHGFTDDEASIVADVMQDVGLTAAATGAQSRAAAEAVQRELVRRGRTELAQRLVARGGRGIPYVGAAMNVLACGQGVWDAIYGSRPRPVGDDRDYSDYLHSDYYEVMRPPGDPGAPFDPPLYRVVTSWDPNEKVGTVGRSGYVMPGEELPYRVLFENETEFDGMPTVPAQEVFISDVILSEHVDLERFSFTAAGFGDHHVVFDEGTTTISHDVHLDLPDRNVVVEIRGGLDLETRTIEVSFRGIDPDTGDLDWEGFLPPNHNPPEGDGYIAFETAVTDDAPSGAVISNGATIVFDVNPPIITNEVSVTVDDVPPVSTVVALDPVQESETFEVVVDASDDVSGVYQIHLWVSEEEYVAGAMQPAANIVVDDRVFSLRGVYDGEEDPRFEFEGRDGYVYHFYTVASDVAGNRELPPTTAQASTRVSVPPSTEHTFPAGIQMVSVPVIPDEADPAQMGFDDGKWARWDHGAGDYVLYDNDPDGYTRFDPAASVPGKGYWTRFAAATDVNVAGEPVSGDAYVVQLPAGWSQIGSPRLTAVPWSILGDAALKVRHNGAEMTLAEAQAAGVCEDFAWAHRQGAG